MSSRTVVDADAHYLESYDELVSYLDDDDPWKGRFSPSDNDNDNVSANVFPSSTGSREVYGRIQRPESSYREKPMTPEEIPSTMKYLGVDKIVMISHNVLNFGRLRADDERPVKFSNMYVDYMLDQVVDPEEGIYTIIPVPYMDPDASVELIDRVGDERGMVGICMITAGVEPPLGHRRYEPIYEAAEEHDLPVIFHTGGAGLEEYHIRGYEKFIETHTLGFLSNNAAQLTSVVIQGIPEKFPDLDIAFLESGIFYVPMLMHRLDAEYMKRPSEVPILQKRPSEYMKEIYYGTQPLENPEKEKFLETTIEMIGGPDRLVYASDYPHWDYDPPKVIEDISFLSEEEKDKILSGNAEELYGI
jgi:predicted TIM-barrel fold metal-dependent hydrolase